MIPVFFSNAANIMLCQAKPDTTTNAAKDTSYLRFAALNSEDMAVPSNTEKPSTATTAVDNSANIAARQAGLGQSNVDEAGQPGQGQQKEKSEVEKLAEKEYEERIEEEYAKREGGA
jgi:hypothetical protein